MSTIFNLILGIEFLALIVIVLCYFMEYRIFRDFEVSRSRVIKSVVVGMSYPLLMLATLFGLPSYGLLGFLGTFIVTFSLLNVLINYGDIKASVTLETETWLQHHLLVFRPVMGLMFAAYMLYFVMSFTINFT